MRRVGAALAGAVLLALLALLALPPLVQRTGA